MSKVSVIVPVYNVELYLRECMDSIINQTLQDIEIICINDGSTDNSPAILDEYRRIDNRIQIINQENKGLSNARNTGLDCAKGTYIHFMDSDDMLQTDTLIEAYTIAQEHKSDAVFFDASIIYENNELVEEYSDYPATYYIRNNDYSGITEGKKLFAAMHKNGEYRTQVCMQLIRTEFLIENDLRFYEGIYHEDQLFTLLCMLQAKRVYYINKPFFIRRIRTGSIMTEQKNFNHFYGYFTCFLEILLFTGKNNYDDEVMHYIIKQMINIHYSMLKIYINSENTESWISSLNIFERCIANVVIVPSNELSLAKNQIKALNEKLFRKEQEHDKSPAHLSSGSDENNKIPILKRMIKKCRRLLARFLPVPARSFHIKMQELMDRNTNDVIDIKHILEQMRKVNNDELDVLKHKVNTSEKIIFELKNTLNKVTAELNNAIKTSKEAVLSDTGVLKDTTGVLKDTTGIIKGAVSEVLWAQIYENASYDCNWLINKNFSPGRWAVGYQYFYVLYRILNEVKPKNILELGLGQSTRLIAQYAKYYDDVIHQVTEHDEKWIGHFSRGFSLSERTKLVALSLEEEKFMDDNVTVYSGFEDVFKGQKFDLISIDGPFGDTSEKYGRIDVLKLLPECLADSFIILVDDFNRKHEQNTVRLMEQTLHNNNIAYKVKTYEGQKYTRVIVSEDLRFVCTM
ncbi:MAG: glycosyltransferase [Oscillospiraceae bacterium]|jgi:glycosyltransferase involved in cell wall biosynthesis|nr:glycosyltransferase [Oscillospiraceae bacterium]